MEVPRVRVDHVEKVIEAQPNLVWDQQRKGLNQQAWVYNWLVPEIQMVDRIIEVPQVQDIATWLHVASAADQLNKISASLPPSA